MSRVDKVSEAVRQEASLIIHDKLKDPRLGFVTITHVEMTPDLRLAKIYFSVLGKPEDFKKTKEALDSALGLIRSLIAQRINLRLAPEIIFYEDHSSEYSVRIQEVLDKIKEGQEKRADVTKTKRGRKSATRKSSRSHKKV